MSKKTEFQKLKKEWYKKLEESGFDDIEQDEDKLKSWSSKFATPQARELAESKSAYYYMAETFLREHSFQDNLEQIIWEYHTNAISVRNIAQLLNDTGVAKTNRQTVWLVINRLEKIMKTRYLLGFSNE